MFTNFGSRVEVFLKEIKVLEKNDKYIRFIIDFFAKVDGEFLIYKEEKVPFYGIYVLLNEKPSYAEDYYFCDGFIQSYEGEWSMDFSEEGTILDQNMMKVKARTEKVIFGELKREILVELLPYLEGKFKKHRLRLLL